MIEKEALKKLLKEYQLNENLVEKNNYIAIKSNYEDIKGILDYLIFIQRVPLNKIEKCPSILLSSTKRIRENYKLLSISKLEKHNIDNCLHILSCETDKLQDSVKYITENYGIVVLNKIPSILSVPVDHIKKVEEIFDSYGLKKDKLVLSISVHTYGKRNGGTIEDISKIGKIIELCKKEQIEIASNMFLAKIDDFEEIINICKENNIKVTGSIFVKEKEEIKRLIETCKENNIKITGTVFLKRKEELEKIINICKKYNVKLMNSMFYKNAEEVEKIIRLCIEKDISITGGMFLKKANELEEIIKVCDKYNIPIIGSVFQKDAKEVERILEFYKANKLRITSNIFIKSYSEIIKIIKLCEDYGIEVKRSIFLKNSSELQESIDFICENYGKEYLHALTIIIDKNHLKKVFDLLQEKAILEMVIKSPVILRLSYDKIKTRLSYLEDNNIDIIVKGKYNSIFGMNDERLMKNYGITQEDLDKKYGKKEEKSLIKK